MRKLPALLDQKSPCMKTSKMTVSDKEKLIKLLMHLAEYYRNIDKHDICLELRRLASEVK